jgi:hypothetical protein
MWLYINTCKWFTVLLLFMKQLSLVYGQVIHDVEEVTRMPDEIEEESFLKTIEFRVRSRISFGFKISIFLGNPWWCCRILGRGV